MKAEYLTRQSELIDKAVLDTEITIVGAGAIGSFVALTLAKMGFGSITVYDDDVIDEENMNCQFYRVADIGTEKVYALKKLIKDFTTTEINAIHDRVTGADDLADAAIVISAVDCMEARKTIFDSIGESTTHLLDGRMGAEYIVATCTDMKDETSKGEYAKTLYTNEEAVQERCTAKATMYTVNLIAGILGKMVKDVTMYKQPMTSLDWNVKDNGAIWFNGTTKGTM